MGQGKQYKNIFVHMGKESKFGRCGGGNKEIVFEIKWKIC